MARDLLTAIRNKRLELYPDNALIDDLFRLSIVERRYGLRLEAVSDDRGHADRAIALAIALPVAMELASIEDVADVGPDEPPDFNPVEYATLDGWGVNGW
jgi:hypothetical protein